MTFIIQYEISGMTRKYLLLPVSLECYKKKYNRNSQGTRVWITVLVVTFFAYYEGGNEMDDAIAAILQLNFNFAIKFLIPY